MNIFVLNSDFESIRILDTFESLIWTNRYCGFGDFELYTPFDASLLVDLKEDNYLRLGNDIMIIEDIQLKTDVEVGNKLIITGRSLESILERRIIWGQTVLNGNFQTEIQRLLNENAINPTNPYRKISRLTFETSTDPLVTNLAVTGQYVGENLYDVIQVLCQEKNLGFKIELSDSNAFNFKLYSGKDLSYSQVNNPYVVFSPKFENLLNSDYKESKRKLKTSILVAGEGDPATRLTTSIESLIDPASDLERREMYNDASDISQSTSDGSLTQEEYLLELDQRGRELLSLNTFISSFEGEIPTTNPMYTYGVDFLLGDIVEIENEYGLTAKAQVIEFIQSQNNSGINNYPTFAQII
jgi:hypothetical protein